LKNNIRRQSSILTLPTVPVTGKTPEQLLNKIPPPSDHLPMPSSPQGENAKYNAALLQTAREKERAIIARELHDEFAQLFTAIKLDLLWLTRKLPDANHKIHSRLDEMVEYIDEAMRRAWEIASELRPRMLEDLGLEKAIHWQLNKFMERTDTACTSDISILDQYKFAEDLQIALYRITQEALANIARHANASKVHISAVQHSSGLLELLIIDNGRGLPSGKIYDANSLGLAGMLERANVFGGSVFFESPAKGGTIVTIRVPPQIVALNNTEKEALD
jgi:signal transduction histidine kinase